MTPNAMKAIILFAGNNFREVFRTIPVQIWSLIAGAAIIAFAIGADVLRIPNGVIWSLFGKEQPMFDTLFPKMSTFLIHLGIVVFCPIGIATSVHATIQSATVSYYLARPVSRATVMLGQILGASIAYGVIIFVYYGLLVVVVWFHSGIWMMALVYQGLLFMPISFALHTFLVFTIIASRSIGTGLLFYLLNVFLLDYLLESYTATGSALWEKIASLVIRGLAYVLPSTSLILSFELPDIALVFDGLLALALSIVTFSILSIALYKRMEF